MRLSDVKKVISLGLALLLAISLFAGCTVKPGNTDSSSKPIESSGKSEAGKLDYLNESGFPIVNKPITIKMMGRKNVTHANWEDMLVWQEYEKMTGIHVEWITPDQSGYNEKKNLAFASGDLPDAFFKGFLTNQDLMSYGAQGMLIRLNELVDKYAPNVIDCFEKWPEARKATVTPDGSMYSLPRMQVDPVSFVGDQHYIQQEWLKELNMSVPTTTDEYYEVLKAFKTKDFNGNNKADEIPLLSENGAGGMIQTFLGFWGLANRGGRHIDQGPDGKVRFISTTDKYKDMLMYLNKLYTEDLFYKQSFTLKRQEASALGPQGVIGSVVCSGIDMYVPPTEAGKYISMATLKGPFGDQIASQYDVVASRIGAFAITDKNKYPEATMRWIDYFFSLEGHLLFFGGIEGKTYNFRADGTPAWIDEISYNPNRTVDEGIGQFTPLPGGSDPVVSFWTKTVYSNPEAYAAKVEALKLVEPYFPEEAWPSFMYTDSENAEMMTIKTDIETYVEEWVAKFVTGAEPFTKWDDYVNTLNKMGLEKYMQISQNAVDRWNK